MDITRNGQLRITAFGRAASPPRLPECTTGLMSAEDSAYTPDGGGGDWLIDPLDWDP